MMNFALQLMKTAGLGAVPMSPASSLQAAKVQLSIDIRLFVNTIFIGCNGFRLFQRRFRVCFQWFWTVFRRFCDCVWEASGSLMMNSVLKLMKFVLKLINFVFKMTQASGSLSLGEERSPRKSAPPPLPQDPKPMDALELGETRPKQGDHSRPKQGDHSKAAPPPLPSAAAERQPTTAPSNQAPPPVPAAAPPPVPVEQPLAVPDAPPPDVPDVAPPPVPAAPPPAVPDVAPPPVPDAAPATAAPALQSGASPPPSPPVPAHLLIDHSLTMKAMIKECQDWWQQHAHLNPNDEVVAGLKGTMTFFFFQTMDFILKTMDFALKNSNPVQPGGILSLHLILTKSS